MFFIVSVIAADFCQRTGADNNTCQRIHGSTGRQSVGSTHITGEKIGASDNFWMAAKDIKNDGFSGIINM
ncbi:MAG: hypothetical protein AAB221_06615, partial [Bacteroidota bacterium]